MDELHSEFLKLEDECKTSSIKREMLIDAIKKIRAYDEEEHKLHLSAKGDKDIFGGTFDECRRRIESANNKYTLPIVQIGDSEKLYVGSGCHSFDYIMQEAIRDKDLFAMMGKPVPKKIRIRLAFRDKEPFFMIFEYRGSETEALQQALKFVYKDATISTDDNCVLVSELVDDYYDYRRKYAALMEDSKMSRFRDDIYIWDTQFPNDVGVIYQPLNPSFWNEFKGKMVFNIVDNRTINNTYYNNCNIINSGGGSVSISDVAKAIGISESQTDSGYLAWISKNQPSHGELRSVYFIRMKNSNSQFICSKQVHNKYMRALGWVDGKVGVNRCWLKK